ncbi:DUF4167 domain-containing protein [Paracoccus sp. 11-3]|uniref:DUF4167 domain-containing protein n=1 Tax=Paracoccus amoyensis TaxID=2760093 RepID=A0A926GGH4_9RHOB|nr:DUF4167 domain-containing protein [Paracoccus amoyensis]MBC9246627.1 DUF4167 domain-containing protein [Paracoccus amoyensis]
MRSSKSRSRNKSNRQRSLGNIVNRVFDSSGPEGKVRGTPQQIIEKYLTLARDAQLSNDRVAEQSFLQHAEHYTRMLGEAQREMAERQQQHNQHQRQDDDGTAPAHDGNGNGHTSNNGHGRNHNRDNNRDQGGRDTYRERTSRDEESASPSRQDMQEPEQGILAVDDSEKDGLPAALAASDEDDATGLIETPENAPKPARARTPRPRTPRAPGTATRGRRKATDADEGAAAAPQAEPETPDQD